MRLVLLALRRPISVVVTLVAVALLAALAIQRMPVDIFPDLGAPTIYVAQPYGGMDPSQMEGFITYYYEYHFLYITGIEHVESKSIQGASLMKLAFHPGTDMSQAMAQVVGYVNRARAFMPAGAVPPFIVRYDAGSVPVGQLVFSSPTRSPGEMQNIALNQVRPLFATLPGVSAPPPFGGNQRTVVVRLDPDKMRAYRISPEEAITAVNRASAVMPSGNVRTGDLTRIANTNATIGGNVAELLDAPVRGVSGPSVYLRDVATAEVGTDIVTGYAHVNGRRTVYIEVTKRSDASTLAVIQRVREAMPRMQAVCPPDVTISLVFDQSKYVTGAIRSLVTEGLIGALLTGLMVLLFLRDWRSALIVVTTIPFALLSAVVWLWASGQTINIMTLGGLALAVGILVDDATVTIENINWHLEQGKSVEAAILDGAQQIAVPAFVSTLCICIVFVPVVFLSGTAKYLFTPLALAVVLAMQASYLLSRTLVPTMVLYLLRPEVDRYRVPEGEEEGHEGGFFWKIHHAFHVRFERMRAGYAKLLDAALAHRGLVLACFAVLFIGCGSLIPFTGSDFFPNVDAGQIRLHVRAAGGTRIEETEQRFAQVEAAIRRIIPARELTQILDNIGLPFGGINLAFSDSATVGSFDGEILVSLDAKNHSPTEGYIRQLRHELGREFPDLDFFFQPADIVGQILNFGLPAPLDVQVIGPVRNAAANLEIARELERRMARIPGAVDVHLHQVVDVPEVRLAVDRTKASEAGLTQRDVANSMLVSLSSSTQVAPNYWLNPANGVQYIIAVQTPEYKMDSMDALLATPVRGASGNPQLLSNLARVERGTSASIINHYNVQPVYDIYANVQDRDLGAVASEVDKAIAAVRPKLARGSSIETRGQVETMRTSFAGLALGLVFAIVLVYFVMVVNFQSWADPFIILMAIPGALAGIVVMLAATGTTISVPSLMGAIMSIGVATANSILLVTFANDRRGEGCDARTAALEAGHTRLRPVVMTALAMMIGMLPMALGFGEGGEQNAPLGRAVIGGLLMATFATLFLAPVVYSLVGERAPRSHEIEDY